MFYSMKNSWGVTRRAVEQEHRCVLTILNIRMVIHTNSLIVTKHMTTILFHKQWQITDRWCVLNPADSGSLFVWYFLITDHND